MTTTLSLDDLIARICKLEAWTFEAAGAGWVIEIPQPEGRKQRVFAAMVMDGSDPLVRYTSKVGDAEKVDGSRAKIALELNATMLHGCMAIDRGTLVLTDTRPLRNTTPESSAQAVKYIAKQADGYERKIYGEDDFH